MVCLSFRLQVCEAAQSATTPADDSDVTELAKAKTKEGNVLAYRQIATDRGADDGTSLPVDRKVENQNE